MTIEEAKVKIKELKRKLRFTHSSREKALICTDIMSLESYIKRSGEHTFDADLDYFAYKLYKDKMLKEKKSRAFEIADSSALELDVANIYIDLFDRHEFIPHLNSFFPYINEDIYAEVLKDFVGTLGDKVFKVYNKIILNDDIVVQDLRTYGGVCWDFPTLDRQVVSYNVVDPQYVYFVIAHELGHAVQMNYMNQVGRRTLEATSFCESISSLMEILFQKYLESINFNVFDLYHFNTSVKLDFALTLQLASLLTLDNQAFFDGVELYFEGIDLEKYKDKLKERYMYTYEALANNSMNYQDGVFYTIGDSCARKIYESTDTPKEAIESMLRFLNDATLRTQRQNIEFLGLNTFVPASLEEDIVKYKFRPKNN